MSIEGLLEDSIIADFQSDPVLQQQEIHKHDYAGALGGDNQATDQEVTSVIVVTATDRGEFKIGSGIRHLNVEVEVRVNGAADNFNGTLLDSLTEKVRLRLMPSPFASGVIPFREATFSNPAIKVFGITNQDATQRIDKDLERIRTVAAVFIASQTG